MNHWIATEAPDASDSFSASADRFVVVDVGANTGTYLALCASLARQAGKMPSLTCIEANPKTQGRLAANLHFSVLETCAKIIPRAVSDVPGTVMLNIAQWNLASVKVTEVAGPLKARKLISVPALGPFLQVAPKALLPPMVLAETKHDKGDAVSKLLLKAGYRATHLGRSLPPKQTK